MEHPVCVHEAVFVHYSLEPVFPWLETMVRTASSKAKVEVLYVLELPHWQERKMTS